MTEPPSPREVFHQLVEGVADQRWDDVVQLYAEHTYVEHPFDPFAGPPLRSRSELREHFTAKAPAEPSLQIRQLRRRPTNMTIHETADPEVIVAEFAYQGTVVETGAAFTLPCIFVLRVQAGQIVASRDYIDRLGSARIHGHLDELVDAIKVAAGA